MAESGWTLIWSGLAEFNSLEEDYSGAALRSDYSVDWELEGVVVEHVRPLDVFHSQSGMIHSS